MPARPLVIRRLDIPDSLCDCFFVLCCNWEGWHVTAEHLVGAIMQREGPRRPRPKLNFWGWCVCRFWQHKQKNVQLSDFPQVCITCCKLEACMREDVAQHEETADHAPPRNGLKARVGCHPFCCSCWRRLRLRCCQRSPEYRVAECLEVLVRLACGAGGRRPEAGT